MALGQKSTAIASKLKVKSLAVTFNIFRIMLEQGFEKGSIRHFICFLQIGSRNDRSFVSDMIESCQNHFVIISAQFVTYVSE
jgi:hypothetical protein